MSSEQAKCREFSVVANSILKSLEESPPTLDFVVIDEHLHDSTRSCTTAREFVDSIHRKNFALQRTAPMYRIIDQIRSTGVHKMVNAFKPINLSAFIHLPNDHTNGFMDWLELIQDEHDEGVARTIRNEIKSIKERLLKLCDVEFLTAPRPLGENPVHIAFLLELHALGIGKSEKSPESG